ncbi:DNA primase [Freshwater phage uvFW-CGR-AMD-COM-C440]|jgi:DNA primase|nr:DNA primase [Freshwater phage uvFW-CGR-AMD-COM-C440]
MARLSKSQRELLAKATENYERNLGEALPYLQSRGITEETARMFRLGFVKNPETGHELYQGKLSIPYLTPAGVIDIRFRSLSNDSGPKYLSRPGASTHIYNIGALSRDNGMLVVCEGEIDTIIATQVGFIAVGLPGANNWKQFYSRVLDGWDKIMLFCDGDNAGREMAKTISRELDNVFPVFMPDNQDVNDVFLAEGAEGLRRRVGV